MKNQGEYYDNIAEGFANMRRTFAYEQPFLDLFIEHLEANASILDVGCGSGVPIAGYLMEKGFIVTGVDGSKQLLNIARKNFPGMKFVFGDVRTIEIKYAFDGIIEWWCLFHLPQADQLRMLERFYDWLKPGGILQFTTGDDEFTGENADMLSQHLAFYSCHPLQYEQKLNELGFELLLKESDQPQHLVWLAKK